jgi:putative nucleotidyltransferase with HDIG domain
MSILRARITSFVIGIIWIVIFVKSQLFLAFPILVPLLTVVAIVMTGLSIWLIDKSLNVVSYVAINMSLNLIIGGAVLYMFSASLSSQAVLILLLILSLVLLLSFLTVTSMRIATEQGQETHDRLNQRTDQLLYLQQVGMAMNSSEEIASFIYVVLMATSNITGATRLALLTKSQDSDELSYNSGLGVDGMEKEIESLIQGSVIKAVIDSGRSILYPFTKLHSDFVRTVTEDDIEAMTLVKGSSVMALPLIRKDGCWGVFYAERDMGPDGESFVMDDHEVFRVLASQISVALENADLYFQTKESYRSTVEALAAAIDAKDKYTSGHSTAVSRYAVPVAREMMMSDDELESIEFAALLHDIGKIAVPEAVLNKPGKLTREEFEQIKIHPSAGADIIGSVSFLKTAVSSVKHHHERWDGKGYPDGLKGDDIPLCAQVVGIVDTFDAMTSTRSYRKALSEEEAVKEIKRCSGSQFNPAVVEAFVNAYNAGFIKIQENRSAYEFTGDTSFLKESSEKISEAEKSDS